METLSVENATLIDDMAQMIEEVYQLNIKMIGI